MIFGREMFLLSTMIGLLGSLFMTIKQLTLHALNSFLIALQFVLTSK